MGDRLVGCWIFYCISTAQCPKIVDSRYILLGMKSYCSMCAQFTLCENITNIGKEICVLSELCCIKVLMSA